MKKKRNEVRESNSISNCEKGPQCQGLTAPPFWDPRSISIGVDMLSSLAPVGTFFLRDRTIKPKRRFHKKWKKRLTFSHWFKGGCFEAKKKRAQHRLSLLSRDYHSLFRRSVAILGLTQRAGKRSRFLWIRKHQLSMSVGSRSPSVAVA